MSWMMDEYETIARMRVPDVITGKSVSSGGSLGRAEATGYGVVICIREAFKRMGEDLAGKTAAIQGSGMVAKYACEKFTELGGKVVCVSCWDNNTKKAFTYTYEPGIDAQALIDIVDEIGTVDPIKAEALGWKQEEGEKWIEKDVDVLMPCAIENSIRGDNAGLISPQVKIIAEGANGPTTQEADEIIKEKGIYVIPDFLANAGGVMVSYFEQVQNKMMFYWSREEVLEKQDTKMTSSFHSVADLSDEKKLFMRDAAYHISISRVAQSVRDRGWIKE
jgi:glutamate dehydrogenase (NAD(P)+)